MLRTKYRMQRVAAILMMFILSVHTVGQLGVVLWFQLNQRAIATRYCENRQRPALHCNGKCYLAKQLKKAGNDCSPEKKTSNGNELLCYIIPGQMQISAVAFLQACARYAHHQYCPMEGVTIAVFQPPPAHAIIA